MFWSLLTSVYIVNILSIFSYSLNQDVEAENQTRLKGITDKSYSYRAIDVGKVEKKKTPAQLSLELKLDARVMLIKKTESGRANGSFGTVVNFIADYPVVRFDSDQQDEFIQQATFDIYSQGNRVGQRKQVPIII